MTNDKPTPRVSQGLIWRFLDEDTVLVSPRTGDVRVLNGIGTFIWKLMLKETCVAEIESCLVSQYNVQDETARDDLDRFLADLSERGLITWNT